MQHTTCGGWDIEDVNCRAMREWESAPPLRGTPVPNGPTLCGRLLWGTLLSNNLTWLEWTQIDRPRALNLSVFIDSKE